LSGQGGALLSLLREIPGLLQTRVGRAKIRGGILYRLWPLTSLIAILCRLTIARRVSVIAVVGSYGKTTTTKSVVAALGDLIRDPSSLRGLAGNHRAGVASLIMRLRPSDRCVVLEVGISATGQMAPMARTIRPDIAVVTCIGSEHNRSLPTLDTTRHEKAEMVRALSPSALAVLNGDDPNVLWMSSQTRARVVTYGTAAHNGIRATDIRLDWPLGMRFLVHARGETREFQTHLIGRHMVYPVLAAIAVALSMGRSLESCAPPLQTLRPEPGRMQLQHLDNGAVLLCDYFKSSYETITAAFDTLSEIPATRRFVVLGDVSEPPGSMGPICREFGERIAHIASRAIFVGSSFRRYRTGATRSGMPASALTGVGHRVLDAVELLRSELGPGDVVLIKGRDNQRLDRIALALAGRNVRCIIPDCRLKRPRCDSCPMLETGWQGTSAST
jgi:UDP-N-acetylmuramoyl-tripeptide--D-alanyl-D-alanine ligase